MPHALAPDMARGSLAVLLARIEEPDYSADDARELRAGCEIAVRMLEGIWQSIKASVDHGVEATKVTFLLKEMEDVVEAALKAFEVAGGRVKAASLTDQERAEGVAALEEMSQRTAAIRAELVPLLRWLQRPWPKIDPATLPNPGCRPDAPGYIGFDEFMKDFLSDG